MAYDADRALAEAREDATIETLRNIGAPTTDEQGRHLTGNGMLVDWLAGRRAEGWIGPDPMRDAFRAGKKSAYDEMARAGANV